MRVRFSQPLVKPVRWHLRLAWRCGDTELCTHDGQSLEVFQLSAHMLDTSPGTSAFSVLSRSVRLSGSSVVWHEFFYDPDSCAPEEEDCDGLSNARLHVLDVSTPGGTDLVIAEDTRLASLARQSGTFNTPISAADLQLIAAAVTARS